MKNYEIKPSKIPAHLKTTIANYFHNLPGTFPDEPAETVRQLITHGHKHPEWNALQLPVTITINGTTRHHTIDLWYLTVQDNAIKASMVFNGMHMTYWADCGYDKVQELQRLLEKHKGENWITEEN